jgi:hypothetical protein
VWLDSSMRDIRGVSAHAVCSVWEPYSQNNEYSALQARVLYGNQCWCQGTWKGAVLFWLAPVAYLSGTPG